MDWIVSSTVILRGPMCILLVFFGERLGLKRWLHVSSVLAIGGEKLNFLDLLIKYIKSLTNYPPITIFNQDTFLHTFIQIGMYNHNLHCFVL